MERFIRADLAQTLSAPQIEIEDVPVYRECTVENQAIDLEHINALLREAEQNAIAREQLGRLNPHVNVLRGAKWKVLLKRLVRKLSWWMVDPLTAGQNYYNELTIGISNAIRDCVCMLKDIVARQHQEICMLKGHIQAQDAQLQALQAQQEKKISALENYLQVQNQRFETLEAEQRKKLSILKEEFREQSEAWKKFEVWQGKYVKEQELRAKGISGQQQEQFRALQKELRIATEDLNRRYWRNNAEWKEAFRTQRTEICEQQVQQQKKLGMLEGLFQTQKDEFKSLKTQLNELVQSEQENITDYIDYEDFENTFRGSKGEICTRIERYLQYFHQGDRVLDLGCGQGEWLELLRGYGVEAVGVDISSSFIQICKRKGLKVVEQDLFSYLESQSDESLDGITAIQVIEHLTPVELAKLVQLCCAKLKLGGRLIFETQNPAVVSTMTNNFYIDPTHIRPVHPTWIKYLLEKNFFSEVSLDYPEYAWVTAGSIPALNEVDENTELFNQQIAYLNNFLYGSTDYAVIAKK